MSVADEINMQQLGQESHAPQQRKPFRILAINGGGMLGLMPARVLQHVETVTGKSIRESFDLIAGTSVGSLIAGIVTSPTETTIGDAINKLENTNMFKSTWFRDITSVAGLLRPRIPTAVRDAELSALLGETTLGECSPDVLTVSFDVRHNKPRIFTTKNDPQIQVLDAVKASASVPTVWEPLEIDGALCIDGGLFSNNPTLYAIAYAMSVYDVQPEDIAVFSLGTGYLINSEEDNTGPGGIISTLTAPLFTGRRMVEMLIRTFASSNTVNSVALTETLLNKMDRFIHLDFPLRLTQFKFLSTQKSDINALETVAQKVIQEERDIISEFCQYLIGETRDGLLGSDAHRSNVRRFYNNIK